MAHCGTRGGIGGQNRAPPSLVAADGVVHYLGGRSGIGSLAVRMGGTGDVTATHRLWTSERGSNVSSPVFKDGHLYWAHESRGIAYCVKAARGEVVYCERLERAGQFYASALLADGRLYCVKAARGEVVYCERLERAGQFYASALLADGRLYYVDRGGKTFVVAARPRFELVAVNDLSDGGVFNATPVVSGSRLLVRSDKHLYCIGSD
ncbi:MAG: PQQ-like beta-propeller repeat protein [Armatimonadetes bacterium]|nr:PQQ-like beta-propeller repeat protein [Armatimonadota bacterium]